MRGSLQYILVTLLVVLSACSKDEEPTAYRPHLPSASRHGQPTVAVPVNVGWPMHGNDHGEQRFSPLNQIHSGNIHELDLTWYADIPSIDGLAATPVVVDGIIFMSTTFANIVALDAATGSTLWQFNPQVRLNFSLASSWAARINRGVAVWRDKVFVGTGDCRLVSVDKLTGKKEWDVETCDPSAGYGITGAPRAAGGKVFIGNMGADFGARGYISAYDADSGEFIWRFWMMPGDPAQGYEIDVLAMAAETWTGDNYWEYGGGSPWDSMSYDPELNLLFVGTDSAPVLPSQRSPRGGDNLFLSSIVALDADTGAYRWHYQTTPADAWHYDATMQLVLAELNIGGEQRKVIMQAPKNGFFYILDRASGELLSATGYVDMNWAMGVDMTTGRPVENPAARFYQTGEQEFELMPSGSLGAHNWHPMSFNPETGLVYIPVHNIPARYRMGESILYGGATVDLYGVDPDDTVRLSRTGSLLAWDPVAGKARWQYPHPLPMNGGVLSTAGDLVFQGTAHGEFKSYHAETGELLWQQPVQASVQAPPVSYAVDGEQYILLPAGAGGTARIIAPKYGDAARGPSRLLAYKLGGTVTLPPWTDDRPPIPEPPDITASLETIQRGKQLFNEIGCNLCHGIDAEVGFGNSAPDLRYLDREEHEQWDEIVLSGIRIMNGMPPFAAILTRDDSRAIHSFVISQTEKARALENP